MNLIELIIGNFIGFGFALFLYKLTNFFIEVRLQKNFLNLIKDEIIYNKKALIVLLSMDFKEGDTAVRLKTDNKEGCWSRIIEFGHKNTKLIREISNLYELFRGITFALNFQPFFIEGKEGLNQYCDKKMEAIKSYSEGKKGCLYKIDEVIKLIDIELNKYIWR